MDIPDQLKLKYILVQGGAFKATLLNEPYPRYYFVLNLDPVKDDLVVLVTSTTQFELHRNCQNENDVHVPLGPQDYDGFTENCLICCNWVPKIFPRQKLEQKLSSQRFAILPPLNPKVLGLISHAVAKSKTIEPHIKKMILGEPE